MNSEKPANTPPSGGPSSNQPAGGDRPKRSRRPRRGGSSSNSGPGGGGDSRNNAKPNPRTGVDRASGGRPSSQRQSQPGRSGPSGSRRPPRSGGGGGRPAPTPAAETPKVGKDVQTLALTAWDISRTRKQAPDSSRGHVMTLRAHQKLVASFEKDRRIPDPDRSYLRVKENAQGSCLLIHGISTRPGDLHELASVLFDADYNVYVLRLPDYGTPGHTISEVSWESALHQAHQCYSLLSKGGGRVHVIGMGFGAALALHLAQKENVSSLVLLAPAIMPRESFIQRMLVRLKLHRLDFVHNWLGWNADLMEGMDIARGRIGKVKAPIFAAQCDDDDRASPASLRILQSKSRHSASRFQVFTEGGHSILAVHGQNGLYDQILNFCGGGR